LSYYYEENYSITTNSTKICKNNDGNGYIISGYFGNGSIYYPLILFIDGNGNLTDQTILDIPGVYLDVEATNDGGCIAVGFQSESIKQESGNSGRKGLITKFDASLNQTWSRVFHNVLSLDNDNSSFNIAENVSVINSIHTNYIEHYFVMGTISNVNGVRNGASTVVPHAYATYIDVNGNLIYEQTYKIDYVFTDATYDNNNHEIIFVGKWDENQDQGSHIGKISVFNGSISSFKSFEGNSNSQFFMHFPCPYKIVLKNNQLHVFGYERTLHVNNLRRNKVMIPYYSIFDINLNVINVVLNHTDTTKTNLYPLLDADFLNCYDGTYGSSSFNVFSFCNLSVFAPEVEDVYELDNNLHYAMLGYYDYSNNGTFDLHIYNSSGNNQCDYIERSFQFGLPSINTIETYESLVSYIALKKNIIKNDMILTQEICE
jgi:hypothetical protein